MPPAILSHSFAVPFSLPWSVPRSSLSLEGQQIVAARRDEPGAFDALVRRHQGPLFNFCLRMLGQPDDAADVAQETFVQLYSHLGHLNEYEPLSPWLFRVARNRCIDVIRRRRTVSLNANEQEDYELVDEEPLPEELVEHKDLQRLLHAAIAQ